MSLFLGLDIGGTKFLVAAADDRGNILRKIQEQTPLEFDVGLDKLHRMIEEASGGDEIAAIGAAIGGPLDWKRGIVSPLHQPEWRNIPLKELMEEKWGCPFYVDVDTNIAALGEWRFGAESAPRFLYITLSTGMGGGFLINGKIYRGMADQHPEIAHQSINYRCSNPEKIFCECGVPDCLEALVSGNAIRRIYGKPAERLDDQEWEEVAYNLGQGLRNLAAIYLPDVIVLGGGVAIGGGEKFFARAQNVMENHLKIVPPPRLRLSSLGYDTALMGTIAVAMYGID